MTAILLLSLKSLRNRQGTVLLTIFAIGLSVTLLLGVERLRTESRQSFTSTIAGTDLVIGARSSPIQLLLYAVFRIGDATNNISWKSYQHIAQLPAVEWTIPLTLGDSHRGYRILGTSSDYFAHFKYGEKKPLTFTAGRAFDDLYDAVLGAEVARTLGYQLATTIILAHGAGKASILEHADQPFTVVGILEPTGTPVDKTIHIRIEGFEAIHLGWQDGAPPAGKGISAERIRQLRLTPKAITACLVKLESPIAIFGIQRQINQYGEEALTAILPGVALQQLWELVGVAEKALFVVSVFVIVVGLFGMLCVLLTSLNERRREMAILRSLGARPCQVFSLLVGEATLLTTLGIALGVVMLYALLLGARPLLVVQFGIYLSLSGLSGYEMMLLSIVWLAGLTIGLMPGWRIYRYSLVDGLTIRT